MAGSTVVSSLCGGLGARVQLTGLGARVQLTVGNTQVHVAQQKEGRCETSRSMLDLSVCGLIHIVATIGGWMNVVGSMHAEVLPVRCEETLGSPED